LTDSKTSIFPSLSRFLSRLDMETRDFPLLHGWFLDRLGNLRFSCTCTIILSRPTWEPLIFPHLRGFLSRQNTGKSNFPRSHRFSRVRGWEPRISHTCTVPIADGHGSPKFLALRLGGSRRGRTWKPEVSHAYAWVAFVAVEHGNPRFPTLAILGGFRCGRTWKPRVSHGCAFGRVPSRPDMETPRFLTLVLGRFPSRPDMETPHAWAVLLSADLETPNFVTATEVFHRGRTRKPRISSQLRRFSIAVVHGNP
jgi:hypothetical protein